MLGRAAQRGWLGIEHEGCALEPQQLRTTLTAAAGCCPPLLIQGGDYTFSSNVARHAPRKTSLKSPPRERWLPEAARVGLFLTPNNPLHCPASPKEESGGMGAAKPP
jgi:hypothetical protein